jgi:transcriptional regulator with XRE-family HTH domain
MNEDFYSEFRKILKNERIKRGLNQTDFAKLLFAYSDNENLAAQAKIKKIENGDQKDFSYQEILKIVKILKIENVLNKLFNDFTPTNTSSTTTSSFLANSPPGLDAADIERLAALMIQLQGLEKPARDKAFTAIENVIKGKIVKKGEDKK